MLRQVHEESICGGCAHLVTQGILSGRPGCSLSSSASRPPKWPADQDSCQSDLDTTEIQSVS